MKTALLSLVFTSALAVAESQYNQEFVVSPATPTAPEGVIVMNPSGIAAALQRIEGEDKIIVAQVFEGGPSERAGLQINDQIQEIDGESVAGQALLAVVRRLRGDPGTEVQIKIERKGEARTIRIVRDVIRLPFAEEDFIIDIKNNKYMIRDLEVSLKEIDLSLSQRASINKEWPIILRSDSMTSYSTVTAILDICKEKGLTNVTFPKAKE